MLSTEFRSSTLKMLKTIIKNKNYKLETKRLEGDGKSYKYGTEWVMSDENSNEIFSVTESVMRHTRPDNSTFDISNYGISIGKKSYYGDFVDGELKDLIQDLKSEILIRQSENQKQKEESEQQSRENSATNFLMQYMSDSKAK